MRHAGELITETGRITARHDGLLHVKMIASDSCSKCGLCRTAEDGTMVVEVADDPRFHVGQGVRVTFPYRSHWRAMFFVFALPMVLFFVFGFGASALLEAAGASGTVAVMVTAAGAVGGLALGIVVASRIDRRFHNRLVKDTKLEPADESGA